MAAQQDYLYKLARSESKEDRVSLAKSIVGLLRNPLSKSETTLIQDILLRMLREAENELRKSLAEYLAEENKCPQAVIDYLIYECPVSVSEPLLKKSTALSDDFLMEVATKFKALPYWQAIASRPHLSQRLALFLLKVEEFEICEILIKNRNVDFCPESMDILTDAAILNQDLSEPLSERKEVTSEMMAKLYHHASEQLQEKIQQRFNIDKQVLEKALHYVVIRKIERGSRIETISMEMLDLVRKMPKISTRQIVDAMKKGDKPMFSCLCAMYLKINPQKIMDKLQARPTLALAVISRAINITRAEYNAIFIQWRRQESNSGILKAYEITYAMSIFDQTKVDQAKLEVKKWI